MFSEADVLSSECNVKERQWYYLKVFAIITGCYLE
jgi:hypothetical protein